MGLALVGLALCSRPLLAAPGGEYEDKDWHFDLTDTETIIAESEPNDTCPGQPMSCGDVISPAALTAGDLDWYQFSAVAGDKLTIGTDVVVPGNSCDTVVELYRDDCTSFLTSDDDGGPGVYSLISGFTAPYTGTYNIKVRGFSGTTTGPYSLFVICCPGAGGPPDDTCAGASTLLCGIGTLAGSTACYTNDYDPGVPGPSCTGFSAAGRDLVYVLNLSSGDVVDLTYTSTADGSFYIVTDCDNETSSCVAGADATLSGEPEVIHYVAGGGIYYLILDSFGTNTAGSWTLVYSITCPVATGACCLEDGTCLVLTEEDCVARGGDYLGDDVTCGPPNPCEVVPSFESSWGAIKNTYRD
jgi:hypothetical protein